MPHRKPSRRTVVPRPFTALLTAAGLTALAAIVPLSPGAAATPSPTAGAVAVPTEWAPSQLLAPVTRYYDPGMRQVMSFSTPDDQAVAVWADNDSTALLSVVRAKDATTWSAPVTVATDGQFWVNAIEGSAPDGAVAPNGDITLTWPSLTGPIQGIRVTTRHAGRWAPPVMVTTGPLLTDPHIAYGSNGTAALVWNDGTSVFTSTLAPGAATWTSPVIVSDQVVLDPTQPATWPLLRDARVSVSSTGDIAVSWEAESGQTSDAHSSYRLRTTSQSGATGNWSAPIWVSAPNERLETSQIRYLSDGGMLALWQGAQDTGHYHLFASTLSDGRWSDPSDLATTTSEVAQVLPGPGGTVTAEWLDYDSTGAAAVRVADYRPASGWSASTLLSRYLVAFPTLTTGPAGAPTAAWRSCDTLTTCHLELSTRTADGWSPPEVVSAVGTGLGGFALSSSPSGWLNVVYNRAVSIRNPPDGTYEIRAAGTIRPLLSVTLPAKIAGSPKVGGVLTASTGAWVQPPTSFGYQWRRNGSAIAGATRPTYPPVLADVATRLSVSVTGHRAGYRDAATVSATVLVARPPILNRSRPTVTGSPTVGHILTGHAGSWTPTPSVYHYQWLRNGAPIKGASRYVYRLLAADRGRNIALRVRVNRTPYLDGVATSASLRAN